jgi:hypothetical protein
MDFRALPGELASGGVFWGGVKRGGGVWKRKRPKELGHRGYTGIRAEKLARQSMGSCVGTVLVLAHFSSFF